MSNLQKRRPPLLNILLLLCAATVTLATLKSGDGSTGRSQQDIEWHGEDRQRLLVQIGPLAGRLDDFDYGGGLMLRLQLDHIPRPRPDCHGGP